MRNDYSTVYKQLHLVIEDENHLIIKDDVTRNAHYYQLQRNAME